MTGRRIAFVSGTRADAGKLAPLMRSARAAGHDVHVIATGQHLEPGYGDTLDELRRDAVVWPTPNGVAMGADLALGATAHLVALLLPVIEPDLLVVHGDRAEPLAAAHAAAVAGVRCAHVEGGETSGHVDESVRHAITKLAHLHLVANEEARERVLQLGEEPERITVIGSPEVDALLAPDLPAAADVLGSLGARAWAGGYGILAWHPDRADMGGLQRATEALVEAVRCTEIPWLVLEPNADRGRDVIAAVYDHRLTGCSWARRVVSLPFLAFAALMRDARVVAGNSSCVVREAPVYGTPTVELGLRQRGRSRRAGRRVVDMSFPAILDALTRALGAGRDEPSREYGDGRSAERFVTWLATSSTWSVPLEKAWRWWPLR